ncbi:MAG: hypothetical protein Q8O87_03890 [bacterium]|nr:hypothetical protein [bacterium]
MNLYVMDYTDVSPFTLLIAAEDEESAYQEAINNNPYLAEASRAHLKFTHIGTARADIIPGVIRMLGYIQYQPAS